MFARGAYLSSRISCQTSLASPFGPGRVVLNASNNGAISPHVIVEGSNRQSPSSMNAYGKPLMKTVSEFSSMYLYRVG